MSDAGNKQQQPQPQGTVVEQGVQQIQVQMSHDGQQAGAQHAVVGVPQQNAQHHQQAGGVAVVSSGTTQCVVPTSSMAQQLQQQQQVAVSMQQQTMQSPPVIAPAPMQPPPPLSQAATTTITTMSTLHSPLQHPMPPPTPQTLTQHTGVPHSQLQQVNDWGHGRVQVIQQPLQNPTYLQQLYNTQGQLLMPGNLQLHPAGMNPSSIHVITAGKPFQPNQIPPQMITTQKSVLQGQPTSFPGYAAIPTTTNQTLVISQLGVISNPQNILPAHSAAGAKPTDMQKVMGSKAVGGSGSSMKGGGGPQQSSGYVVSQPQQLITTQTPTTAMLGTGQATQFISPIQYTTCGGGRAVQQNSQPMQFSPWQFGGPSLPQGITWATASGGLQPPTLLTTQNPIFIRSQQDGTGMFIQSPPPQLQSHNPTLTATQTAMPNVQQMTGKPRPTMEIQANIQPKAAVPRALSNILPSMSTANNIRPASSVSTQTGGSTQVNAAQVQTQKPQAKVRSKPAMSRTSPAPGAQKADAANQTKPQSGSPAAPQQQQLVASTTTATKMIVTSVSTGVAGTSMTSVGSPVSAEKAQQTMVAQTNTAKMLTPQQQQQVAMQSQQQQPPQLTVQQQQQINMQQQQQIQQMQHFQQQMQQQLQPQPQVQSLQPQQLQTPQQPQQVPQQQSPQPHQMQPQIQQPQPQPQQQQPQPQPQPQLQPQVQPQVQAQVQPQLQQMQPQPQPQPQQVQTAAQQQQQPVQQMQQKPVIGIAVVSQQQQQLTSQQEQRPVAPLTCPPVHSASSPSPAPAQVATPPPPSPVPVPTPPAPSPQAASTAVPSPPLAAAQATQTSKDDALGGKSSEEPLQEAAVPMEVEESTESEAPSEVPKDKAVSSALVENSNNSTPDDGKVEKERDKGLPKALVKPHILTHVIDGFVIREAGDPFPSRATVHSELVQITKSVNHQLLNERKTYTDSDEPPKKKQSVEASPSSPPGPKGELAKCEFCGKTDVRSRFRKSSKRFCSVACSKSKRVGLYKPATSNNNNNTVSTNNNMSLDGHQPDSKDHRQKNLGKNKDVVPGQSQAVAATDENTDTNDSAASGAESSLSPSEAPEVPPVDMEDSSAESVLSSAQPKINPLKWTVSEVCEFIRTLPGCSDYVDDFAIQEIDGQALMLLKEDHLMQAMSMKLGPALKIVAKIDTMRGDKDK